MGRDRLGQSQGLLTILAAGVIAVMALAGVVPANQKEYGEDLHDIYEKPSEAQEWGSIAWGYLKQLFTRDEFGKAHALVVGLGRYESWGPLEAPYQDAVRVRDYFVNEAGYDYVVTLTNEEATLSRIKFYMEEFFPQRVGSMDKFLFYFSGHGTQKSLPKGRGVRGYLPMLHSKEEEWSTMLSMDEVHEWQQAIAAKQTLFLLDACFSGLAGYEVKGGQRELYLEDLWRPAHLLMTAGTANQKSRAADIWAGSLFTDAFLDGAQGAADSSVAEYPKDGVVSSSELVTYIKKRVNAERERYPQMGIDQTPQAKQLALSEGEFFFLTPTAIASKGLPEHLLPPPDIKEKGPTTKEPPPANRRPNLGASFTGPGPKHPEIEELIPGGPADQAGLKAGDVILLFDRQEVIGLQGFVTLLRLTESGQKILLTIERDGRELTVPVTLGAKP